MLRPLRRVLLVALSVSLLPLHALGVTSAGSDDFDDDSVDSGLWGADLGSGGTLTETNQRLEYTVAPPGDALMIRPWILSPASYDESWSLRLDIHVGNVSLPSDGQDLMFGMGISAGGYNAALNIEFENLGGTLLRGFHAVNEGPGGVEGMAPTATTDGAGLLTFDASTKELAYWFDENGAAGGYAWTLFKTVDLDAPGTDWGLSPGASFEIGLFGESHGITVASGDAFGDDFAVMPASAAEFEAALDGVLDSIADAGNALISSGEDQSLPDLLQSGQDLDAAIGMLNAIVLDLAAPNTQAALGSSFSNTNKQLLSLGKGLLKARSGISKLESVGDTAPKSIEKAIKSFAKLNTTGSLARQALAPATGAPFLIVERSKTGGFLKPWQAIVFELVPNPFYQPACEGYAVLEVVNPGSGGIVLEEQPNLMPMIGHPFILFAGPDGGGASLRVTACGTTRERIVHNKGTISTGPLTNACDGHFVGSFSGSVKGESFGYCPAIGDGCWTPFTQSIVGEPLEFTIQNGLVSIEVPPSGTGRAWATGALRGGGSTTVQGVPVFFVVEGKCKSGLTASGSWQAPFSHDDGESAVRGTSSGKWNAVRTP